MSARGPRPKKPKSASSSTDKTPIQAVMRAFAVMEALSRAPGGLRLADLSRLVGLHKATVFRLLKTMVQLGYVTQADDRAIYRPLRRIQ